MEKESKVFYNWSDIPIKSRRWYDNTLLASTSSPFCSCRHISNKTRMNWNGHHGFPCPSCKLFRTRWYSRWTHLGVIESGWGTISFSDMTLTSGRISASLVPRLGCKPPTSGSLDVDCLMAKSYRIDLLPRYQVSRFPVPAFVKEPFRICMAFADSYLYWYHCCHFRSMFVLEV